MCFGCVFCFLLRVKLIPDPGQVLGYGSNAYHSGEKDGRDSGREIHTHTHTTSPGIIDVTIDRQLLQLSSMYSSLSGAVIYTARSRDLVVVDCLSS